MRHAGATFLTSHWHEPTRTLGELLAAYVRQRFPRDTIKQTAKALDCTLDAAANVTKGHASERTLTKAFQVWPWELATAAGEAFSGRTYAEELKAIIEAGAHEQRKREAEQDHIQRLEQSAARLVDLLDRPAA